MLLAEELHLARSERRLELNVEEIYGELTCMDIDPPEEGTVHTHSEEEANLLSVRASLKCSDFGLHL